MTSSRPMERWLRSLAQMWMWHRWGVVAAWIWLGCSFSFPAVARERSPTESVDAVALADLPVEARDTHRLILQGGPFPYPRKDGSVFGNRERLLPRHPRGYYLDYTVPTPGSRGRGARRIVCGGNLPKAPEVCYYTRDHYASFRRIAS